MTKPRKKKGTKNLTYTKRLILEQCLKANLNKREIAKKLGCCLTTVYNEIKRGTYEKKVIKYTTYYGDSVYKKVKAYSPEVSQEKYDFNKSAHGPKPKIDNNYAFVNYVEKRVIKDKLSPCAVLGEIKKQHLFDLDISKTTLYRYISQGMFMNITLKDTPYPRKKRKRKTKVTKKISKGTSIEFRPLEIFSRKTFGHWEMDCVVAKRDSKGVLLCLTERLTRFELVMLMPDRKTETVVKHLNKLERRFGKNFRIIFKSITCDNGVEFSDYENLEKSIYKGQRTKLYYCHPYTSCERGSNERINRDIRRLIPKGEDFADKTKEQIQAIENWVNSYPRAIFGYKTSKERFEEELSKVIN